LAKPWDDRRLIASVQNLLELGQANRALRQRVVAEQRQRHALEHDFDLRGMVWQDPATERVVHLACQVARADVPVLISGPNGSGKERIAAIVQANSQVAGGPFVVLNCGAVPVELIEAELFGAEAGAYTGITRARDGKFDAADGGTLFLDEIGDMPLELQATLLRVLENKRVIRVGGKSYKQIDFRLVAATNQNLPKLVSQHQFREDLFYRISVLTVDLPPLRDRLGDALYFARFFLNECQIRTDGGKVELSSEAARFVSSYAWPGNVRQLKHAIYAAYYTCENHSISVDDFPNYIVNAPDSPHQKDTEDTTAENNPESLNESSSSIKVPDTATSAAKNDDPVSTSDGPLPTLSLKELEALAINEAILQADGNIATAAAILDISKATLYRKLKENQ
ncbi:MAG: sigma-54 dependent transcriptional regulator, partial [Gordonibacter sp.]|uniref:sigma-54 dependent transcriptional regulator n=1 Tax=Gordonibacter sp. TaxID=1968902 RepID=UPI0032206B7C